MTTKANQKASSTATKGTIKELKSKMDRKAIQEAMAADGQERANKVLECLKENNCRIRAVTVLIDGQETERRYEIIPNFD